MENVILKFSNSGLTAQEVQGLEFDSGVCQQPHCTAPTSHLSKVSISGLTQKCLVCTTELHGGQVYVWPAQTASPWRLRAGGASEVIETLSACSQNNPQRTGLWLQCDVLLEDQRTYCSVKPGVHGCILSTSRFSFAGGIFLVTEVVASYRGGIFLPPFILDTWIPYRCGTDTRLLPSRALRIQPRHPRTGQELQHCRLEIGTKITF